MNVLEYGTNEISLLELKSTSGGHPLLVVLGVVTTVVSIGKAMDQASEWFLDGWNNPN